MNEETWVIEIGDKTYTVPRLPLRVSRVVYPICQQFSNSDFVERLLDPRPDKRFVVTDDEMDNLVKITMLACQVADPELTAEAFDEMPIKPSQLFDAFFAIRYACGGWNKVADTEGGDAPGEASGAPPQT